MKSNYTFAAVRQHTAFASAIQANADGMTMPSSFLPWQQLRNDVRRIPLDDATQLVVDGGDVVHGLDLLAKSSLGTQWTAEHEFAAWPAARRARDQ
jgi:hypothetical protein